ncbi:unnamed protein product [Parascedosporium putredinis]|uniref:DUF3752 domain-containing protein n=1 Tax=Parascedosporium putredinis TaxID=1442378 RepID=A0A9P1H9S8_9PEZI|nr:unnamed protein product [Parascedosporium putredinis]CAI8002004.1 unnamed protein product [Parascedosporium putredinis]
MTKPNELRSIGSTACKGANNDEIDLGDESSDDDGGYGPVAPKVPSQGASAAGPAIGPSMPPSSTHNADEIDLDDDDVGPLQPPPVDANTISPPSHKRSVGPTMRPRVNQYRQNTPLSFWPGVWPRSPPRPQAHLWPFSPPVSSSAQTTRPNPSPDSDADSDSDSDDYGPALPSAATSSRPAYTSRMPQEAAPEPTKRDEWMLAPPSASDRREQDPTKLKNRSFRSGPSAATSANAQKLGLQAFGRRLPKKNLRACRIRLYEERQEAKKRGKMKPQDEEDDPSKRPFDREKDMAIGGNLGAAKKRELLNKSSNFGDRFQKGSYL